jgi:quinol-cytochrome oxidoreductase complex cytochrome b subunit
MIAVTESDDFLNPISKAAAEHIAAEFRSRSPKLEAKPQKEIQKEKKTKWYELEALIPYHDVIFLVGFLLAVGAVAVFSWGGALFLLGTGLMGLGYLMGKSV